MYVLMYVLMYVCMLYMYVCMYVHTYIHMYVCTYVFMYACMYVHMNACIYVFMYVCVYVCIHVCTDSETFWYERVPGRFNHIEMAGACGKNGLRIPKRMLFGWLPQRRPAHGTKMRWRDRARKDLKKFGIEEGSWYKVAQNRGSWRERCRVGLEDATEKRMGEDEMRKKRRAARLSSEVSSQLEELEVTALPFKCDTCQCTLRRRQDIARHRCVTTRPKDQVMSRP